MERGDWPTRDSGLPIQFQEYDEAKQELITRLGCYCSYCEMPIKNAPAVEHLQPKSKVLEDERTWCNLLLSCVYCNSSKGHNRLVIEDYFWPDRDNTFRALSYVEAMISPASGLDSCDADRASRTIWLTGLDKLPGGSREPSPADRRWSERREAWGQAEQARKRLSQRDTPELRETIVALAIKTGFWSVWMTVFADDKEMRRRLISEFRGTSTHCFDDDCRPLPRRCGTL